MKPGLKLVIGTRSVLPQRCQTRTIHHLCQGRQLFTGTPSKIEKLVGDERNTAQTHRPHAGQHDDPDQFAAQGSYLEPVCDWGLHAFPKSISDAINRPTPTPDQVAINP